MPAIGNQGFRGNVRNRFVLAGAVLSGLALDVAPAAAVIKLLPAIEQLYSSVEREPPSAAHITVCYGLVCRLRLTLVFTVAERTTLAKLMAKGRASPAEERKAIQQVFVWFDHRVARDAAPTIAWPMRTSVLSTPITISTAGTPREPPRVCCW